MIKSKDKRPLKVHFKLLFTQILYKFLHNRFSCRIFSFLLGKIEPIVKSKFMPIVFHRLGSTWKVSLFVDSKELHSYFSYICADFSQFRVFANGPGDLGSIRRCVRPKTFKMVFDTSLLNTQQYNVGIKSKVEQSRERSGTIPYTSV